MTRDFGKVLASLTLLALFILGIGKAAFFPSLRLFEDTSWDPCFFLPTWGPRLLSFLWIVPVTLGFLGWSCFFQNILPRKIEKETAAFLGLSLTLSFFSLCVFGLAINGILYWPLTALFFIPALLEGWRSCGAMKFQALNVEISGWKVLWLIPFLLWAFEYLSPPLVWDAVLDHFRYAKEVSRLHQIPLYWVNHTGDMPKAAELVLAGFWSLGGESLSKLALALPALLTGWLLALFLRGEWGRGRTAQWIFWTCPFFLALYAFGYAEGFLAFFEAAALYCLWKGTGEPQRPVWPCLAAFFLGTALAVKYTAALALAAILVVWIYGAWGKKAPLKWSPASLLFFILPFFPWFLKNWLAFGNPVYPLAASLFGAPVGYSPEMERGLLGDTGVPWGMGLAQRLSILWHCFFTTSNGVNAAWTPLVAMSLPWWRGVLKNRLGRFLAIYGLVFATGWLCVSSSLRHFSGGAVALVLLATLAWNAAFRKKERRGKPLFALGAALSLWMCLSTQLTTTAPYASALGMEDTLLRLQRHYSYDTDVYRAYHFIEEHSNPWDKVMAFAVWQAYPLQRTVFVDFKWKKPIFLDWASHCQTAGQLAKKLHEEGVNFFLYQRFEAGAMEKMEKDFKLVGMPVSEYEKFWSLYMEPVPIGENSTVYRVRARPLEKPLKLHTVPGLPS